MRFSSCGRTTTRPRCRNSGTRSDSRSPKDRVFRTPPLQLNVHADIRRGERTVLEARILQDLAALLFSLERQTSLKQAEVDLHGPVHVDRADEPRPALEDGSPHLDPPGPDVRTAGAPIKPTTRDFKPSPALPRWITRGSDDSGRIADPQLPHRGRSGGPRPERHPDLGGDVAGRRADARGRVHAGGEAADCDPVG